MGQPEHIFITRINNPFPYWNLRFRHNRKIIHRQAFRDHLYGSKEKSLEVALAKRGKIAHSLGIDLDKHWHDCKIKKYRYTQRAGKRSSTGVPGVTYSANGWYRYYKASICLEKYKETVKSFNCDVLGDDEALRLAIEQRKEWEQGLLKTPT